MAKYTIDQLVHETGVPSSTVRMYGNKRLLPPPDRQGRVGYYDDSHVQRLRLIERLQSSGYSLAAIGDLIKAHDRGDGLAAILGGVATTGEPKRISYEELSEHFPEDSLTQESVVKAMSMGLMRFEGDDVVLDHPQFLDIGARLSALGFSGDSYVDEYETLSTHADAIARSFAKLFETELWNKASQANTLADQMPALTSALGSIGPLAETMVSEVFRISLRKAAQAFLDDHRAEIQELGLDLDIDAIFGPDRPE